MMLEYFNNLISGIEAKQHLGKSSARSRFALELARLGRGLYSGDGTVAWCGILAPFDLLHAMGVTSCFVEFVGAMLASTGTVGPMMEQSEQLGYSTDGCSYHRAVYGAMAQGLMPEPDFLIGTSAVCSAGLASIENLACHYGKEMLTIHVPIDDSPAAVAYLADQFREMTHFVARQTGRPLDPGHLREVIGRTNRMRELTLEVYRLARRVPTPARRRDLVNFGIVSALFLGTPGGVEVVEAYCNEFAEKVAGEKPGLADERLRLLWVQNRIQFANPLEKLLEQEYGAAVVADELNDINWDPIDPEDPFTGMARRALSVSFCGPAKHRLQVLLRLARDYRVDGAINPCHWGCRQGTGARGLLERGLREAGVPTLNLEVDCVDSRSFSEGQLKTRLEAFMETLSRRKSSGLN